jgi:hypothetical protein
MKFSKRMKTKLTMKITNKMHIGVDEICRGLNEELTLSTSSLKSFDSFIGRIFRLDFKFTIIKTKIMETMKLTFVENIMKNNIDDFIKLQISEFILQINNPDTNTQFLSNFEYKYFKKHLVASIADKLLDKYEKGRYIDKYGKIEKYLKNKDIEQEIDQEKKIYEEMIGFIKNSFVKYDKNDKHRQMFINYFLYYYYELISLVNDFINNEQKLTFAILKQYNGSCS